MAGDWIKMRGNLWDDPRVAHLCELTDQSEAAVIGGLYWLWATADQHTENGFLPGLTLRQIDRKTGVQKLGQALCAIGWLEEAADGIRIINFEEHNGSSAKRRSLDAQRKANVRTVSAPDADNTKKSGGQIAPSCGAREREEKRREEEIPLAPNGACPPDGEPTPKTGYAVPDCPHEAIVTMFHERLPSLPRVEVWSETRKGYLRQRWREVCSEQKFTAQQGLEWFADFFAIVGRSQFLTGKAKPKPGERAFLADLEWLVRPQNFVKVIEGKYQQ